jgi:hypothetical protein
VAKEHAIQAAQYQLALEGVDAEVVDVELLPVGRVVVRLRDGTKLTVDRWVAVKLRTLMKRRWPRARYTPEEAASK